MFKSKPAVLAASHARAGIRGALSPAFTTSILPTSESDGLITSAGVLADLSLNTSTQEPTSLLRRQLSERNKHLHNMKLLDGHKRKPKMILSAK